MKSVKKILSVAVITVLVAACSKKPDIENTSTVKMAGEWFVQTYEDGDLWQDFAKVITYNTSDPNSNQLWLDDLENIWAFKSKVDIDYPNLAFKPTPAASNLYISGETVNVLEGKIIAGGGHSKTGVAVDSIYLKLKFSDDPDGHTYELKGHGRTGFFEDEY
jgi:hypothetical protein